MKFREEKNLIGKGKYRIKAVDQSLIKLVERIKDEVVNSSICTISKKMHT